ncbi:MAG: zinc-dependent alcohol dehydrogenase family protein [Planctomycetota bacterium]
MQAMVVSQRNPIENRPMHWSELADPQPGWKEIRVKVRCCAICRTDLHVIEGDLERQKLPVVPGHQVVGDVESLGPGCERWAIGQRVGIAWLRHTCGKCDYCVAGKENLCERARFTGYHEDGGYAELAVIHEDYAYEIPVAMSDDQAAPMLCAGIIGYRALERACLPVGGKLVLFGFGSSAHMVLQLARARGSEVFVVSRGTRHQTLARELGAVWVGETAEGLPVKVDSAILFAPVGHLVPPALASLRKGGTLAVAGIHLTPVPELDYQKYLFYERDLRSVTANTRADGCALLEEAAKIKLQPRVVHFGIEEANEALRALKEDQIQGTGVLHVGND